MLNETVSLLRKFYTLSFFFFLFLSQKQNASEAKVLFFSWENYSILSNWLSKTAYGFLRIRHAYNLSQYNSELPEPLEITIGYRRGANYVVIYTVLELYQLFTPWDF